DDVVLAKTEFGQIISCQHLLRYRLAGEFSQSLRCRYLHLYGNLFGASIQRTPEKEWEAQGIIDLVREIRAACRHQYIAAYRMGDRWKDFRVWVGQGEYDGIRRHELQQLRIQCIGG